MNRWVAASTSECVRELVVNIGAIVQVCATKPSLYALLASIPYSSFVTRGVLKVYKGDLYTDASSSHCI